MIIVFGSLNMDLVVRVPQLPRPGETVITAQPYIAKPGGKGNNQAVAAARAGAAVAMCGAVGDDDFGRSLIANLEANGVEAEAVARLAQPTGLAVICVDGQGENAIAVAGGANYGARAAALPAAGLGPGATLLVQMEVPAGENWAAVERAKAAGARTILNVAPAGEVPAEALRRLDVLVANEAEAIATARGLGQDVGSAMVAARALAAAGGPAAIVTLGGKGAVAAVGGALWEVGALPLTPLDTTGAGDAFTGVLAAALDAGLDLPEGLRRASIAGGLACLALGAQDSLPTADAVAAQLPHLAPARRLH